jgi:ketosteroid isomerase-like protein
MISAQNNDLNELTSNEAAVKQVVEQFLLAAGNYDYDAMTTLFSKNANIGGVSFKNGKWKTYTITLDEFIELLKSESDPIKYTEPVSKFTVHISEGMLAFVKADAVLKRNGKAYTNNFDYFTLINENGDWKIVNGSYVAVPIDK